MGILLLRAALLAGVAGLGISCAVEPAAAPDPATPAGPRAARAAAPEPFPAREAPAALRETALRFAALGREGGLAHALLAELCLLAPKRLAGSEGAAAAVDWAEATLRRLGFDAVRREPVEVAVWTRGVEEEATVRAGDDVFETLRVCALGGSPGTPPEGLEAEVVRVGSVAELERLDARARGKIVFFDGAMDPSDPDTFRAYGAAVDQRSRGAIAASRAGAIAALVRSMTTRLDDAPHTGAMRVRDADGTEAVPAAAVSTLGAERLAALLRTAREPVRLRLRLGCRWNGTRRSWNVVGEIRGAELPDEIVLVGGHLDAWDVGQGAHDDGAGCVQSMEALRLVRAAGIRPKRTLRCVLFMNEENGLDGARAYGEAHAAETHVFAIESDRGGFAPRGIGTTATGALRDRIAEAVSAAGFLGELRVVEGNGGADLIPLRQRGVPVGELLPDPARYFDFHHSENDVLEAVEAGPLQDGATLLATVLVSVAG